MIVKLIQNEIIKVDKEIGEYNWNPNLTINKSYYVISIEYDNYRIMSDGKKVGPCLYPIELFNIIENSIPSTWVKEMNEFYEIIYWGPKEFYGYFWEDFHNKNFKNQTNIINRYKEFIYG